MKTQRRQTDIRRKTFATEGPLVTQRTLSHRTGSEGPMHDPYGFSEHTVTLNSESCTLHTGLMCYIKVNGEVVLSGTDFPNFGTMNDGMDDVIIATWEEMVGMSLQTFAKAYDRLYPYFDDPMGKLSDYE